MNKCNNVTQEVHKNVTQLANNIYIYIRLYIDCVQIHKIHLVSFIWILKLIKLIKQYGILFLFIEKKYVSIIAKKWVLSNYSPRHAYSKIKKL